MRTLKDSIKDCIEDYMNESRLDEADLDPTLDEIYQFLEENYSFAVRRGTQFEKFIKATKKGNKYVLDSSESLYVEEFSAPSLTNGLFEWGEVKGDFSCSDCKKLRTLEGAPKTVGGNFYCSSCRNLYTLEGAPEYVLGSFDCSNCSSLTSLVGAPKKVRRNFYCKHCDKLQRLDGLGYVGGDLISDL